MPIKPKNQQRESSNSLPLRSREEWNEMYSGVQAGLRPARISLIVNLGTQDREPAVKDYDEKDSYHKKMLDMGKAHTFKERGKTMISIEQRPAEMMAVFADLTSDVVDYGGEVGKKPYRMPLHRVFKGEVNAIPYTTSPPKEDGGLFTFAPSSRWRKMADATGEQRIYTTEEYNMDVDQLLNKPFMIEVEKRENNRDGDIYVNINPKGFVKRPPLPDMPGVPAGTLWPVPELDGHAMRISLNEVYEEHTGKVVPLTKDHLKTVNKGLIACMRKAQEFPGSLLERIIGKNQEQVVEKGEEENDADSPAGQEEAEKPVKVSEAKAKSGPLKQVEPEESPVVEYDMDFDADDIPF